MVGEPSNLHRLSGRRDPERFELMNPICDAILIALDCLGATHYLDNAIC